MQSPARPDRAHDVLAPVEPHDAAVDDVGDLISPLREQVGVVGMGEVARAPRPATSWCPYSHDDPGPPTERDDRDVSENSSLVMIERPSGVRNASSGPANCWPGGGRAGLREAPDDPLARVDDDDPVVVAVGDHQVAGQGRGDGDAAAGRVGRPDRSRRWRRRGQGAWPRDRRRRPAWPARAAPAGAAGAPDPRRRTPSARRPLRPRRARRPRPRRRAAGADGQRGGRAARPAPRRGSSRSGCRPAGRRGRTGGCPRRRPRRGRAAPAVGRRGPPGRRPGRRTRCRASGRRSRPRRRPAPACRPGWPWRVAAQAARQLRRQVGRPAAGVAVDRCVGGGAVPAAGHVDGTADRHRAVVGKRLGQATHAPRRAGRDAYDRVGAFGLAAAEQHRRAAARRCRPIVDRLREVCQRARPPARGRERADRGRRGVGRCEAAGRIDRAAHPGDRRILDRRGQRRQRAGGGAKRRWRDGCAAGGWPSGLGGRLPGRGGRVPPLPPQPQAAHAAPAIAASEANVETAERGALPTPASWPTQALPDLRER